MLTRRGMLGVVLALAILPTQDALADQAADRKQLIQAFTQPAPTPEQVAAQTKLFTRAAATLPPPANAQPKISRSQADEKFEAARAETERKLAANPKQPQLDIAAQVQRLKTPDDAKPATDANAASNASAAGIPPWPTCYRNNGGPDGFCSVQTVNVPAGIAYRGQMIILASGAWDSSPASVANFANVYGQAWANAGYQTHVVEHTALGREILGFHSGEIATINAIQWYDLVRYVYPSDRTCMRGVSSGGHLSLLTAVNRPGLNCVITEASPTDITNTSTGTQAPTGYNGLPSALLEPAVNAAFGSNPTTRTQFSPTAYSFSTRGLIPHAYHDYLVSVLNAYWAPQQFMRPGLFSYIVPDHVCDNVIPSPVYPFGHSCPGDGISSTTALTYAIKQLNMAAYGTP